MDATPAAAAGARAAPATWDEENGIAWVRISLQPAGGTPAFTRTATRLHPDGDRVVVLVYVSAGGEDGVLVRADLLAALRSLRAG